MPIWLPYKAKPHELKNRNKRNTCTHLCSICGKPIHGGGTMCGGCENFIKRKQNEERQGKQ